MASHGEHVHSDCCITHWTGTFSMHDTTYTPSYWLSLEKIGQTKKYARRTKQMNRQMPKFSENQG